MQKFPRATAVRVLTRVLSGREPLDDALNAAAAEARLEGAERAWLQEVCAGALRWKGRLDLALDSIALKKKPSGWLRKALLIASYQLIAQDRSHPGAVVSETVNEIKAREGEAPARFANALLRKVADHAASFREMTFPGTDGSGQAAAWASLPEWLWTRLLRDHGESWAREYARASLERPVTWVRARRSDFRPEWLGDAGEVPGSFRVTGWVGGIGEAAGFREGEFFVQDISSQRLVAGVSARVREALGSGPLRALDLCAAPGGKSAGLSWDGFEVLATDRPDVGEPRFKLLRETLARVAPGARVIPREEVAGLPELDLVWVDAPCMGTGILRRHPDVRWLKQEKDLTGLLPLQQALLREAWGKVRAGGFLAYSVCSVLEEEGPRALSQANLKAEPVETWTLAPHLSPFGDGFWGALVRKPVA